MKHLTAPELANWLEDPQRPAPVLLDVREPWEYDICRIDGSMLVPMNTVPSHLEELGKNQPIVCLCHHGARSLQVAAFLEQEGFTDISNLTGGIHAWSQQVDQAMATY